MAFNRGFDAVNATSRIKLIEAASQLLEDEGGHAVTARAVARVAGLKPQLVHYYFRSMDELIVAVMGKFADDYGADHRRALASDRPLHALWDLHSDRRYTKRIMAFLDLGSRRPAVRSALMQSGANFRSEQVAAITNLFERRNIRSESFTPAGLSLLMASVQRTFALESEVGIDLAHAELRKMVRDLVDRVEPVEDAAVAPGKAAG